MSAIDPQTSNDVATLPDIYLNPQTEISSFDGAGNLGAALWSVSLYYGLFQPFFKGNSVFISQPSEWLLYPIARGLGEEESEWFKNFEEGLQYQTPPAVDVIRGAFFVALGFWTNHVIVDGFGGDLFWGWSTGACLALPATLLSYSRIRRPSRESVDAQNLIRSNFQKFAENKLKRTVGRVAAESNIVLSFRRAFLEYRNRDEVSDKELEKIVRAW